MNAISLEPLKQSTSDLVDDVIPPKGRTLLILGHVKTKMATIKLFNMYAIDTPCDSISLETLNQSTSIFIYDVIPPKGQTLLILVHLLKTRWSPL